MQRTLSLLCATALIAVAASGALAKDNSRGGRETAGLEPFTPVLSASDVREKLMVDGYTNITNLQRNGDLYSAQATRDGEPANPVVDARDGRIVFQ